MERYRKELTKKAVNWNGDGLLAFRNRSGLKELQSGHKLRFKDEDSNKNDEYRDSYSSI